MTINPPNDLETFSTLKKGAAELKISYSLSRRRGSIQHPSNPSVFIPFFTYPLCWTLITRPFLSTFPMNVNRTSFTPAAVPPPAGWPWMNAPTSGRDVAPRGRSSGSRALPVGPTISLVNPDGSKSSDISRAFMPCINKSLWRFSSQATPPSPSSSREGEGHTWDLSFLHTGFRRWITLYLIR